MNSALSGFGLLTYMPRNKMLTKLSDIDFVKWWIEETDQFAIYGENPDGETWECPKSKVLEAVERLRQAAEDAARQEREAYGPIFEFAERGAKTMFDISPSNVWFILGQAYADVTTRDDAATTMRDVIACAAAIRARMK